eukprot:331657-Hanusia_phi.AAC.1
MTLPIQAKPEVDRTLRLAPGTLTSPQWQSPSRSHGPGSFRIAARPPGPLTCQAGTGRHSDGGGAGPGTSDGLGSD